MIEFRRDDPVTVTLGSGTKIDGVVAVPLGIGIFRGYVGVFSADATRFGYFRPAQIESKP